MAQLKLFFCLDRDDGTKEIKVFRDLEMVHTYWSESDRQDATGMIHVGFLRPRLDKIKEFEKFRGKVLATISAKWALPENYKTSNAMIAEVKVSDTWNPCHLILNNFGYECGEPDQSTIVNSSAASEVVGDYTSTSAVTNTSAATATGWVADLADKNPELVQVLIEHGIFDEESYKQLVNSLPASFCEEAGLFRYQSLKNTINLDHVEKLISILPYGDLQSDIGSFDFPIRIYNVLSQQSLEKLGDLQDVLSLTMLSWPNFGKKSLRDLCQTIIKRMDSKLEVYQAGGMKMPEPGSDKYYSTIHEQVEDKATRVAMIDNLSLKAHFERTLDLLEPRTREVIQGRCGFNGKIQTLEEVGVGLGVTRERVRQIQKKFVTKIIRAELWDDVISDKIGQLLVGREKPLILELLELEDEWFAGFMGNYTHLEGIIEMFTECEYRVVKIDGANVVTRLKVDEWNSIVSDFRITLKGKAKEGIWSKKDVDLIFESQLIQVGATELKPLLWDVFSEQLNFDGVEQTSKLLSYGKTADSAIQVVLKQAEMPLHFTEITKLAAEVLGSKLDDRRVQNALIQGEARLFGRGIYGREDFNPVSERMCNNIRLVVGSLIMNGPPMKQWHSNEILNNLKKKFPALPEELDTYILNIILSHSDDLVYLKRMVWARADSNQTVDDRVDMADAFSKILEDHGGPLKGAELKKRLSEVRGVHESLQLQPTERMIQVGPDYWGLIDRDVSASQEAINSLLDELFIYLKKSEEGIHVSEVNDVLKYSEQYIKSTASDYSLLNLAQRDERFYLGRSMFLGLSEWGGDTRRLNYSQAARKVISEMVDPMSTKQISRKMVKLTGLEVDSTLAGLLAKEGARFDQSSGKWFKQ